MTNTLWPDSTSIILYALTHEVVVPGSLGRRHEETEEAVGQQHLHALVVGRQVALGVVTRVRVLTSPLPACWGQLVGRQRAGTGCETVGDRHKVIVIIGISL